MSCLELIVIITYRKEKTVPQLSVVVVVFFYQEHKEKTYIIRFVRYAYITHEMSIDLTVDAYCSLMIKYGCRCVSYSSGQMMSKEKCK